MVLISSNHGVLCEGGDEVIDVNGFRIHAFKTVGTSNLKVIRGGNVEVLVVAGGGGGGGDIGGGGGGGGIVFEHNYNISNGDKTVVVGNGGNGNNGINTQQGFNGENSIFDTLIAIGGGGGGSYMSNAGKNGGCGGGSAGMINTAVTTNVNIGYGNDSIGTKRGQGCNGGKGAGSNSGNGGGGGGGGGWAEPGNNAPGNNIGGNGGSGFNATVYYGSMFGDNGWFSGGGGGGNDDVLSPISTGGNGGGGNGGSWTNINTIINAQNGLVNSGGGGGGGFGLNTSAGGSGGSGIVIVRYPIPFREVNGYNIHVFSVGTHTINVEQGGEIEVLVVGGGGGAASDIGGGGGGGGLLYDKSYFIDEGNIIVAVGKGGKCGNPTSLSNSGYLSDGGTNATTGMGSDGENSIFDSLIAIGGGGGGNYNSLNGKSGGSGGGGGGGSSSGGAPGSGTINQGYNGGLGTSSKSGGGGGAFENGKNYGGDGGNGKFSNISGFNNYYSGGGGGGGVGVYGFGGLGGGGNGGLRNDGSGYQYTSTGLIDVWKPVKYYGYSGYDGIPYSGGGGGGNGGRSPCGNGGSGIIIVRYRSSSKSSNIFFSDLNRSIGYNPYQILYLSEFYGIYPNTPTIGSSDALYANSIKGQFNPTKDVLCQGGEVVDIDGYRIHAFKDIGEHTLKVIHGGITEILIVAGGGSGGYKGPADYDPGGGGGGGEVIILNSYSLTKDEFKISVGAGGQNSNGENSSFHNIFANGGGKGGDGRQKGFDGGSGGGQGRDGAGAGIKGGISTVKRGFGTYGANSITSDGGGGGGASEPGIGIKGGNGITSNISGFITIYGSGGGGGSRGSTGGVGGINAGNGGDANSSLVPPTSGKNNTGGGGGGTGASGGGTHAAGGNGGSGIVIIRYPIYNSGLLDIFGLTLNISYMPNIAFSVRRLFSNYTGPTIRIRRSSDNVETDFYMDTNGNIINIFGHITKDFNEWLNGATAYVTKWYDQSENGYDATESTTTLQPIFSYTNGSYYVEFPATSAGSEKRLTHESITLDASIGYTCCYRVQLRQSNSRLVYYYHASNIVNGGMGMAAENKYRSAGWGTFGNNNSQGISTTLFPQPINIWKVNSHTPDALYEYGISQTLGTIGTEINPSYRISGFLTSIGYRPDYGQLSFVGYMSDIIIFQKNIQNNQRQYIEDYLMNKSIIVPSPEVAYSVKRLFSLYTGPTFRLRRSSDNEEQDIYTDSHGNITRIGNTITNSLYNWLSNATAYIKIWYDQNISEKRYNLIQNTMANQPTFNPETKTVSMTVHNNSPQFFVANSFNPNVTRPFTWYTKANWTQNYINTDMKGYLIDSSVNRISINADSPVTGGIIGMYSGATLETKEFGVTIPTNNLDSIGLEWGLGSMNMTMYKDGQALSVSNTLVRTDVSNYDIEQDLYVGARHSAPDSNWGTMGGEIEYLVLTKNVFNNDFSKQLGTSDFIQGALDAINVTSMPSAAFSMRRLFNSYGGPQIRIRRSSDNVETDIYTDSHGNITSIYGSSTNDLQIWLNGSTGYVTIWYDQSGNSQNVLQTTTINQPYIAANNGIRFSGNSTIELVDATFTGFRTQADQPHTIFIRYDIESIANPLNNIFAIGAPTTSQAIAFHPNASGVSYYYMFSNDIKINNTYENGTLTVRYAGGIGIDKRNVFYNGISQTIVAHTANVGTTALNLGVNPPLRIGNWSIRGKEFGHNGSIYDMIIYNTSLSDQVVTNINSVISTTNDGALDNIQFDSLPSVAYSVRRLFGSYTGPQLRIRRSNDNSEIDVFINKEGDILNLAKFPAIGNELISRSGTDTASTTYVMYGRSLSSIVGYEIRELRIYAQGTNRSIVPLLYEYSGTGTNYILRAIGNTVNITTAGIYSLNFDVGIAKIINTNYVIGWKDGTPTSANQGVIAMVGSGGVDEVRSLTSNSSTNIPLIGTTQTFGNTGLGARIYSIQITDVITPNTKINSYSYWLNNSTAFVTKWYDQSGRNIHVLQTTTTFQPGYANGQIYFDGTTWIESSDSIFSTQVISLYADFTPTLASNDWINVIGKSSNSTYRDYGIWLWSNLFGILWQRYPSGGVSQTGRSDLNNQIRFLGLTDTSGNLKMYIDNKLIASQTINQTYYTTSAPFIIGGHGIIHTRFRGKMRDVLFYNSLINTTDINNLYSSSVIDVNYGALDALNLTTLSIAAYSIRRLFGNYTGPQLRIRRDADNLETDIYMDKNGSIIDIKGTTTIDLDRWLEGSTAYVVVWYDQSGRERHAIQNNMIYQPKYSSSLKEVQIDTSYLVTESFEVPTTPTIYSQAMILNTAGSWCQIVGQGHDSYWMHRKYTNQQNFNPMSGNNTANNAPILGFTYNQYFLAVGQHNGTQNYGAIYNSTGTLQTSSTVAATKSIPTGSTELYIGWTFKLLSTEIMKGSIKDIIINNTIDSTTLQGSIITSLI